MNAILTALKDIQEDWEWYPTDSRMIDCIKSHMIQHYSTYEGRGVALSYVNVLDCGAGDGRVLESLGSQSGLTHKKKKAVKNGK